jgi:hypothetical protein
MDAVPSTPVSQQLSRLVGMPKAPADSHLLSGANRRSYHQDSRLRQLQ